PKDSDPVDTGLLRHSEQLLASAIGASSSRLVHTLLLKRFESSSSADIKLLNQASEALRYNRGVLQTALDQLDQGISVFDADFRLAFWNQRFRRLLDLPPSIGQAGVPINEIARQVAEVHKTDELGLDGSGLADRILNYSDPWLLALNRSERIIEIRTATMPGGGIVVTWHDITDRILVSEALREANETLERRVEERTSDLVSANHQLEDATREADEANRSKTRFLASAGHDIMQPLNAARLYSSALMERMEDGPDSKLAGNICKSLESVEDILGAVLAISRLDTGRQEIKMQACPVQPLIDQMEVEFAPFAAERGIELRFVDTSAWIQTDPGLIRRLLQNLVSNAIKYTVDGKVLVGCRKVGENLRIDVIDTGIGIEEDEKEIAFSEFRRLERGIKHASGLGLGLSIVERIARLLGHEVEIHSTPDQGTRISVIVERAQPVAVASIETRMTAKHPGQKLEGLTVLSIDNDPSILDGMRLLLSQWGCEVHTAADSQEACDTIVQSGRIPEIVLADYHLSHQTGIEAIHEIWTKFGSEIPAVLVTADRTPSLRARAEREGIAVLNKPVRPASLRAILSASKIKRDAAE
ncbi:MAG: hybrid sensor histidine kinase/response regulator, partial [Rhizobiaceae bacterium]